jgi:hypothetical protein
MGEGGSPKVPPIDDVEAVAHHVTTETANHRNVYILNGQSQTLVVVFVNGSHVGKIRR